jgi:hypothetical protein
MKRGIPAVVLLGEDFIAQSEVIARSRGMRLKYAVFPRNIDGMTTEEIKAETDRAYEEVVGLLSRST